MPQDEKSTGYQIYLRVPQEHDATLETVQDYLKQFAELLTDDEHHISVEPYGEDYPPPPHEACKDKDGGEHADSTGGHGSPLYPLYLCHNRI